MEKKSFYLIIFNIIILISSVNSSFMTMPIKSFKKNNIDLPFNDPQVSQYIDPEISINTIISNYFQKTFFAEISAGNPTYNYPLEISPYQYIFSSTIEPKYQRQKNNNFYANSNTYKNISSLEIQKMSNYIRLSDFCNYDDFYFATLNDLNKEEIIIKKVSLSHCVNANYPVSKNYVIEGLKLSDINATFNFYFGLGDNDFLNLLKTQNLFSTYDFKIEFYQNKSINYNEPDDEVGRIIFGDFDKLYNDEKYPSTGIRETKFEQVQTKVNIYGMSLSEVSLGFSNGNNKPIAGYIIGDFRLDLGLLISDKIYADKIEEYFFNKHLDICKKDSDLIIKYATYICKPEIKSYRHDFPTLRIYNKDLDFTFEFTFNDLFKDYKGKYFFLILLPTHNFPQRWNFGQIFLKKYELFFNPELRVIRMYDSNVIPSKPTLLTYVKKVLIGFAIFGLIICAVILAYCIGKFANQKRKKRANELEDEFGYEKTKDKKQRLVMNKDTDIKNLDI